MRRLRDERRAERDRKDARVLAMFARTDRVHAREVAAVLRCNAVKARSWLDSMTKRGLLRAGELVVDGGGNGIRAFGRPT